MGKDRSELDIVETGVEKAPFLKLFKDLVSALKAIASEQRKQTKLLSKISEDLANISTDIEEIKTSL